MNALSPPPVTFIPESAPFTAEQRAWLNGFFAGYLAPGAVETPADLGDLGGDTAPAEDDDAPWHDPAIPLDERMQMADGKPLRRRMMAAMAQQDCGQCGYNCNDYADAIAGKAEPRLNLCVPGEKATARMLKALAAEMDGAAETAAPSTTPVAAVPPPAAVDASRGTRANPVEVTFLSRRRLNKEDSEKSTYHIEFDLAAAGLDYVVGDSFGLFPENEPALADAILDALHIPAGFPIAGKPMRDVLIQDTALGAAPDALFELISYLVGGDRKRKAKLLAKGDDPDGDAHTLDVLAAIEKFPGIRPDPEAFIEVLEPLQPRLYSISSSPKATPGRLSLTVDHVRYLVGERVRRGVASSWLSERLPQHSNLKAYVQKAHDFALPADGATPIIMVGPGTGVAPFRAFLHERAATGATGETWLFFGHQRRAADFFYEEEMAAFQAKGVLSKLFLAWSRDGDKKVYVQDKMREAAADLWAMLEKGAHFYICGDAKRMASDVEKAMTDIVAQHGQRDEAAAKAYIKELRKTGRYQTDVY